SEENLDWALMMEADRMVNSRVAKEDLDTEMTVVRNEYERGENSPLNVLFKRMQSIAYDWHNYGNSTIGNRSDIENVEIENLQAFYRRYYQPDNAVLLVAGRFDPAATLEKINRHFGAIPRPGRTLPKLWTVEPTQDGERSVVVRRVGDIQIVVVAYKTPSPLHEDDAALDFASFALTAVPSGRLHKALVETGKATQVLGGGIAGVDGTLRYFGAVVKKGDPVEPVQQELIRAVEDFAAEPLTAAEMERARLSFANANERTMADHESIGVELSEFIALGDWRMFFLNRDRQQAVTADQAVAAAGRYFRRDNRVLGMFLHEDNPQRAEIPRVASAAEALKDFKPRQVVVEAEEFDPSPENIEQRVRRVEVGGMRIALLSKKNRGNTVVFRMSLPAGDERTLFGQEYVAALTGSMLMRGTTRYSREQLRDEFTRLNVSGGVGSMGANFQTTRPNLAAAIRLAAHVLREPSFPESEFNQLKNQAITSLESSLSEPSSLASEALSRHFNIYPKGDPRYSGTLQEQIEGVRAVTLEDVRRFHRTFYGADRALISIVGDFDEEEVLAAIRESLGDWRSGAPWSRITREHRDIAPANITIQTPDKENAVLLARLNIEVNQNDPDYPALLLADYMLGGDAGFDSRLFGRIRVREGLSYSVGSQVAGPIFDRAGGWMAQAIAAPQNIARVEAALREELQKVIDEGFTDEEVAKAKSGWRLGYADQRSQDAALATRLLSHLDAGRTLLTWDKVFEERVMALTPEQVRAAVRKYIDPSKLTIVKAGDFARVEADAGR
ncbi:MAG: insulinase family protein, partial [Pseudomonadota bacterium]